MSNDTLLILAVGAGAYLLTKNARAQPKTAPAPVFAAQRATDTGSAKLWGAAGSLINRLIGGGAAAASDYQLTAPGYYDSGITSNPFGITPYSDAGIPTNILFGDGLAVNPPGNINPFDLYFRS